MPNLIFICRTMEWRSRATRSLPCSRPPTSMSSPSGLDSSPRHLRELTSRYAQIRPIFSHTDDYFRIWSLPCPLVVAVPLLLQVNNSKISTRTIFWTSWKFHPPFPSQNYPSQKWRNFLRNQNLILKKSHKYRQNSYLPISAAAAPAAAAEAPKGKHSELCADFTWIFQKLLERYFKMD